MARGRALRAEVSRCVARNRCRRSGRSYWSVTRQQGAGPKLTRTQINQCPPGAFARPAAPSITAANGLRLHVRARNSHNEGVKARAPSHAHDTLQLDAAFAVSSIRFVSIRPCANRFKNLARFGKSPKRVGPGRTNYTRVGTATRECSRPAALPRAVSALASSYPVNQRGRQRFVRN